MNDIRIALIEDHDVVRIGLRTVLQNQAGIEVVGEATNGQQGLMLLQTVPVDVALVDVGLPGMDGIELTQRFRQFQLEHRQKEELKLSENPTETDPEKQSQRANTKDHYPSIAHSQWWCLKLMYYSMRSHYKTKWSP